LGGAPVSGPVLAGVALERARAVVVLVHGRDQDERVMLDLAARLALAGVAYLLPVSPDRSWYPGRYFDPPEAHETHLEGALAACEQALTDARRAGVPDERILVGGFSQGACVIAELVARRPARWAGAAVLTGSLLGSAGQRVTPSPAVTGLPMLFGSSLHDEWVAFEDVRASAAAFAAAGARVTLERYEDRVHEIGERAVDGLRALIGRSMQT
ncbi:MAG: alpha/beta hydrolase, partial [Solirubrobacteraceae bacterium]